MDRVKQDIELLVNVTSSIRLLLILGVLLVNLASLIILIFGSRTNWPSYFCVHRITTAIILCSNLAYQCTWLPYLVSSVYNGQWPFLNAREHCIIQYSVTSQAMTILLTVLTVQKLYNYFSPAKAKLLAYSLVIGWILPQTVYIVMVDLVNTEKSSHQYLERLLFTPNHHGNPRSSSPHNHIGFMLCITRLASPVVAQLSWHYLVLVIPLTACIFLCSVGGALKKSSSSTKSHDSYCYCPRDFVVSLTLYFNLMWLIILRPLIVLQTLVLARDEKQLGPNYLDFGTHLVLIFSSILVPFSNCGGFRSKSHVIVDYHDDDLSETDGSSQCSSSIRDSEPSQERY